MDEKRPFASYDQLSATNYTPQESQDVNTTQPSRETRDLPPSYDSPPPYEAMQQPNQPPYPGQPPYQQPYTQQPHTQQPYTQQPYTQQPYTQQPYTQQPYTQQSYVQESYQQHPVSTYTHATRIGVPQSQEQLEDYKVLSIVSVFFCCILGIFALVKSQEARHYMNVGDYNMALIKATRAKNTAILAIVLGCVFIVVVILASITIPFYMLQS